jgi:hypothetical protein
LSTNQYHDIVIKVTTYSKCGGFSPEGIHPVNLLSWTFLKSDSTPLSGHLTRNHLHNLVTRSFHKNMIALVSCITNNNRFTLLMSYTSHCFSNNNEIINVF